MGSLVGEAFDHWINHQGRFWGVAGPSIVAFAALSIIEILSIPHFYAMGWDVPHSLFWSGTRILLITLILYQWFKYALYDDWNQRRSTLLGKDLFPWHAFISGGFIAFLVAQSIFLRIIFLLWGEFLSGRLPSAEEPNRGATVRWLFDVPIDLIGQIALALFFGGFLLFLPSRAAGLSWGPWRAFREASGIRSRLIATAAFLSFVSIAGERILSFLEAFVPPRQGALLDQAWISPVVSIRGLLICFIELLTLYVLAHTVSRLFVMKTGWIPEPYPQPWTSDSAARD